MNDARVPRPSAAIFSGDLLQTRPHSVANINEPGSSITVLSDSLVQFQGASVDIQHGGVTVSTSKEIAATAGDVKVTPASNAWTEFNVVDNDGTVRIAARKGDLLIDDGKDVVTLAQGQETTRDETNPDATQDHEEEEKPEAAASGSDACGRRWGAEFSDRDRNRRGSSDRSYDVGSD